MRPRVIRINADGHCLFRAVAYGLRHYGVNNLNIGNNTIKLQIDQNIRNKNMKDAKFLRQIMINTIETTTNFNEFIENKTEYLKRMRTDYGDSISVNILNNYVQTKGFGGIIIYTRNVNNNRINMYESSPIINTKNGERYIKLLYRPNRNWNSGITHYDLIVDEDNNLMTNKSQVATKESQKNSTKIKRQQALKSLKERKKIKQTKKTNCKFTKNENNNWIHVNRIQAAKNMEQYFLNKANIDSKKLTRSYVSKLLNALKQIQKYKEL